MKFSESRKSPVVGSFTPMTYHSTPNKEGKPLTKTMVDLQLHPSRHSDNVKKTIEVHTDSTKQKPAESQTKKPLDSTKINEITDTADKLNEHISTTEKPIEKLESIEQTELKIAVKDSENKHKDSIENKIGVNEELTTKPTADQLLIDEDIESNEAGILVIDEIQQPNPIEPEAKEVIQSGEKPVIPEMPKQTNISTRTTKPIECKKEILLKSTEKKDGEKPTETSKCDVTEKYVKNPDNSESKSTEVIDTKKPDLPKNIDKKIMEPCSDSKKDTMTTQENKKVLELTQNEKQSDKVISLPEKPEKSAETSDKRKMIDTPKINKKPEIPEPSPTNLGVVAKNTDVLQVVGNVQEHKPNISCNVSNVPKTAKPKIEQNITGKYIPVSVEAVQKPALNIPDSKVIAKSEPVSNAKEITTNTQGAVVDKKPSPAELSKTVESKNKTDISKVDEPKDNKNDIIVAKPNSDVKPINNNHTAVPFGKWTEVNRQEFLNKFKEHKAPINTNSKQIKNSNDLNRRDVLKKIDSQRQSNIASSKDKPPPVKNETIFSNKVPPNKSETNIPVKKDGIEVKPKIVESDKNVTKQEITQKPIKPVASSTVSSSTTVAKVTKKEPLVQNKPVATPSAAPSVSISDLPRREVNVSEPSHREVNVKSLINKTIEDMLNKVTSFPPLPCKAVPDEVRQHDKKDQVAAKVEKKSSDLKLDKHQNVNKKIKILDDIEIKMNELHGIPFVERPAHELPKLNQLDVKASSTLDLENTLSKNIKTTKNEVTNKKSEIIEVDSEEEVIEHEPITGDIGLNSKTSALILPSQEVNVKINVNPTIRNEGAKKEAVITETDFDKFARRNSVTYDNCVTVNLEAKDAHNAGRETFSTIHPKKEIIHLEPESKLHPIRPHNTYSRKPLPNASVSGDSNSKNYQSKIHRAYQSVLTAKLDRHISRPVERPITIIEDKPVKVVFMDAGAEFVPGQLNVQGKELSPAKKHSVKQDALTMSTTESVDKPEATEKIKQNDDTKTKTKHQRKQVLTPVEGVELELIQPRDIGIEVSPKKKRKTEDYKTDKHYKSLTHKKSYLLGRSTTIDEKTDSDLSQTSTINENKVDDSKIVNVNTATALDSLVKAAEMIENQESMNTTSTPSSDSPQNTPAKRGRGRPRKYPLPGTPTDDAKVPTPQKKPRLIDAKPVKEDSISDDDSSDGEIIKENWTMGKINENIVCPICNKLFRSENVVFKHVKHCTGVSPNRSESDKRSSRRDRRSQESDFKSLDSRSDDMDIDSDEKLSETKKRTPKKRKSKDPITKSETDSTEVIDFEDTSAEQKPEGVKKTADEQQKAIKKETKTKVPQRANNLVCEICGKTFRQLSYLVSHRLQHKRDEEKKREKEKDAKGSNKPQVFSCEVCKKEFRKLHHLVQHRIIHNPNTMPSRNTRKTSAEHNDNKTISKDDTIAKQSEDPSAAFRCEPCDKSFRKLHHLVEHRETHDGINRQKVSATAGAVLEKPPPPPQCDICKKTFRKLHHLIEHKEQHAETSSEKSDDKSVKSALSTKDIIHECPLCYMVFPNEHSLNKHSGICQRKKRQSKPAKNIDEDDEVKNDENLVTDDKNIESNEPKIVAVEVIDDSETNVEAKENPESKEKEEIKNTSTNTKVIKSTNEESISTEMKLKEKTPLRDIQDKIEQNVSLIIEAPTAVTHKNEKEKVVENNVKENVTNADKVKKIEEKHVSKTPALRKKSMIKDKVAPTVTQRRRTADATVPIVTEPKPALESSDDDEIRYMFNPNFKVEETSEGKVFMKVRANKRNSLQIERPNSKELVTRRTSLQHPPKIPRLKPKPVEPKIVPTGQTTIKTAPKITKTEIAPSTDSDDSDVKYSFPKTVPEKPAKSVQEVERRQPGRKSLADKRKSLGGIAKRKTMGQSLVAKNKHKPSPVQPVRKREYCNFFLCR